MSGAPARGPAKARSPSFPLEFKPRLTQYLSLTGGPGVYIAFFGTVFTAVQSHILCAVIFYVLGPVVDSSHLARRVQLFVTLLVVWKYAQLEEGCRVCARAAASSSRATVFYPQSLWVIEVVCSLCSCPKCSEVYSYEELATLRPWISTDRSQITVGSDSDRFLRGVHIWVYTSGIHVWDMT